MPDTPRSETLSHSGPMTSELMDVHATALYGGTTTSFVRQMIWQGKLSHFRIGRYVRVARSDWDEFVSTSRVEATEQTASSS